ncbi:unnamed protein product [Trifolium pratense]|uniref:Uncharacterized protein n=1 Tax=Trifolium pratense TaxID=57577 RepID=A0ACB0LLM0_TRIPR|nr:unnamed protein product [Trifolium pratense]
MESEEFAALNHHGFRCFIKKNYLSFEDHRTDEDEEKEFREIMYWDEETMIRPGVHLSSDTIDIGDSLWTCNYSRKGTKLEMSFRLDQSNKLTTIADVLVTVVHQHDPSILLVLSKEVTKGGSIRCNHPQVCQTTNGFMDSSGAVCIRLQIQFRPNKPTIHSFHRHFRLQLYWFKKKMIDKVFSEVTKSLTTTYDQCKKGVSDSRWKRYLVEASKDFSLNKDIFWKGLLDRCKGDYFLVDIVNSGSKLLLNKEPPQLIKAGKDDFHLIGSFDDLLSHTLRLDYLTIHQLDAENLTIEGVREFEDCLLKNGRFVFQCFFINHKFKQSFKQYLEHTNPDLKMDEGKKNISVGDGKCGNSTEEQPADIDYAHSKPSDTKQDELGKAFQAIMTSYKECLKPVEVAGDKYREDMEKIHAEYPVEESSRELEKFISKWHVNAQEYAYDQFREQEEKINDDDYIADSERRKFVSRPTAREKKAIKSDVEAKRIGRMGEEHAYKYFTNKYKEVRWMNEHSEAGHPYDLCVFEEKKPSVYIEVKSTTKLGKIWFYLTLDAYEYAKEYRENYIIAHVYINENEQDETKKYTLTEYVNPLKVGSELKLSMTRSHKQ